MADINGALKLINDSSQVYIYDCLHEVKEKIACKYENGHMVIAGEIYNCTMPESFTERLPNVGSILDKSKAVDNIQLGIVIFNGKIYTGFIKKEQMYATNFIHKGFSIPDMIVSMAWHGDKLESIFKPCDVLKSAYAAAIDICEVFKQNRDSICGKLVEVVPSIAIVSNNMQQLKITTDRKSYFYSISSKYMWFAQMLPCAEFEAVNEYYEPKINVCRAGKLFCLAIKCDDTLCGTTLISDLALLRHLYIHRTLFIDK